MSSHAAGGPASGDGLRDTGAAKGNAPSQEAGAPASARDGDGRRVRRFRADLSTGSVRKHVWSLGWPQVIEQSLNTVDQIVDLIWAGRLPGGYRAVAGLGIGQTFSQFANMTRQGLDQAMRAMVSRAVGAGDIRLANHITLQAFTLNAAYVLVVMLVGVFLTDALLNLVGVSEGLQAETAMYMRIQFIGSGTMALRMMAGAALQASGDVFTPLRATTLTRVLHILATPFLMFGWLWFPEMGLAGAALAGVLAQVSGASLNLYALFRGNGRLHLTFRGYYVDYPVLWRMVKIAAPASLAGTERAIAQITLLWLVTPFGDVATAAYALTRRIEMLSHLGSQAMGQAAGIMVGQNLGAQRPDRARQSVWWALLYITLIQLVMGTLQILFAAALVRLFTGEASVVEIASVWIRLQAVAGLFMGLGQVFQQSYNTAGDTVAPLVVIFVAVWCVEIPLAWALANHTGLGVLGIGVAAIAGMSSRLVGFVPYFFGGRWLRVRVIG